jgi:hypothetical protein
MSRSGYSEDLENWSLIRWRGQVMSAIRGKRGQAFLRELVEALEAMPEKALIKNELQEANGQVCALGALGVKRGVDMALLDPEDAEGVASAFNIAPQLAQEVIFENDEQLYNATPERRWEWMHSWAKGHLKTTNSSSVEEK